MRRHATMGLALFLSAAITGSALAQGGGAKGAGGNAADAGASPTTTPAAAGASASSASDAGATGAAAPASAAAPAASTSADGGAPSQSTAGAASPTAPPSTGPAVEARPAMDGATYAVRLRDLEARVDELKDQIRRSHTRLALLSDTILSGGSAGSRAEVQFANEMSSAFRLTRALVVIDGTVQYNRQDETGALADQKEIPIFSGSVPPGDHTVQVLLNFQGNGYGVFTYLRGYKFEVKSSHSFTSVEGKTLTLTATALEKGGVTTPLEQRPSIEWHEKVQAVSAGTTGAPPGAPGAAAPPAAAPPVSGAAGAGADVSVGGGKK